MARRRDGDIAPYRNGTAPRDSGGALATGTTTGHGEGARCQAAHCGGEPPRAMRRGGASREARRPTIAPQGNAQRDTSGARAKNARCQAAHRGGEPPRAMARRRDGDIAPYRHAARVMRTATGDGRGARATGPDNGTE